MSRGRVFRISRRSDPLPALLGRFLRYPAVWLRLALAIGLLCARLLSGEPPALSEPLVILAVVFFHPNVEYSFHRTMYTRFPAWFDGLLRGAHLRHHADPDARVVPFAPLGWVLFYAGVGSGIAGAVDELLTFVPLLRRWHVAGTPVDAMLMAGAAVVSCWLVTEWMHFLHHNRIHPRSMWYRKLWTRHRLHHYKNDGFWFGIVSHRVDDFYGTNPDTLDVATTPQGGALAAAYNEAHRNRSRSSRDRDDDDDESGERYAHE